MTDRDKELRRTGYYAPVFGSADVVKPGSIRFKGSERWERNRNEDDIEVNWDVFRLTVPLLIDPRMTEAAVQDIKYIE